MATRVMFRHDTKCPYCRHDIYVDIEDRRPNQDLVQCGSTNCQLYFVILKGTMAYPLLNPADPSTPPGMFTIIED